MSLKNAILIYEEDGQIKQRFCPEQEARDFLAVACQEMRGGSMFAADGVEAEFMLSVSPDLRERVREATLKMKKDTRLRDALTRNGVPMERDLRVAIYQALEEFNSGA